MIIPSKEQLKRLLSGIDRYFLLKTVLVFAAFIVPLIILYVIDSGSFNYIWKGRAPYLFFLWLLLLEAILGSCERVVRLNKEVMQKRAEATEKE